MLQCSARAKNRLGRTTNKVVWGEAVAVAGGSLLQVMVTSQMRKRSLRGKTPSRSAFRRSTRQPGHLGRYALAFFASSGSPSGVVPSPLPPPISLARSDSERSNPDQLRPAGRTTALGSAARGMGGGRSTAHGGGRERSCGCGPAGLARSSVHSGPRSAEPRFLLLYGVCLPSST